MTRDRNQVLAAKVWTTLSRDLSLQAMLLTGRIRISTDDGVVYVRGTAGNQAQCVAVEKRIKATDGVRAVINLLHPQIKETATSHPSLEAILGDFSVSEWLAHCQAQAAPSSPACPSHGVPSDNPPIALADVVRDARRRAIVENGPIRVTVTGPGYFHHVELRREAEVFFNQMEAMAALDWQREDTPPSEVQGWLAASAPSEGVIKERGRYDLVDAYLRTDLWEYSDECADGIHDREPDDPLADYIELVQLG